METYKDIYSQIDELFVRYTQERKHKPGEFVFQADATLFEKLKSILHQQNAGDGSNDYVAQKLIDHISEDIAWFSWIDVKNIFETVDFSKLSDDTITYLSRVICPHLEGTYPHHVEFAYPIYRLFEATRNSDSESMKCVHFALFSRLDRVPYYLEETFYARIMAICTDSMGLAPLDNSRNTVFRNN